MGTSARVVGRIEPVGDAADHRLGRAVLVVELDPVLEL